VRLEIVFFAVLLVFLNSGIEIIYAIDDNVERIAANQTLLANNSSFLSNDNISTFVSPFIDVNENDWFFDSVLHAAANNLMHGASATTFAPNGTMSRAMAVTVLYRMEGEPYVAFEPIFYDVPADGWYSNSVLWANQTGIATYVDIGLFAPDRDTSREQLMLMLYNYAQYRAYDTSTPDSVSFDIFTDSAELSDWADQAMRWAVHNEFIYGSNDRLMPGALVTRAEFSAILQRILNRFEQQPTEQVLIRQQDRQDRYHIPWQFITYLEPDFRSAKQEIYAPQRVQPIQSRDDGWAQISTVYGDRWVYLLENKRYVERPAFLFEEPGRAWGQIIEQQVVSVLEQYGHWIQIETWLGPRWIYTNPYIVGKQVALTFDDGPSVHTLRLLDALAERNVSATFFVLGQQVTAHPDWAARIVAEGHEIASHGYWHQVLTHVSEDMARDDLYRTRNSIQQATGATTALFRPAYGEHNSTVRGVAAEFGYPIIMWSVDTRDWESRNVDAIMNHFINQNGVRLRDGDIILLHDIHGTSVDAAIQAVDLMTAKGVSFVTVSELLMERHENLVPGMVYSGQVNPVLYAFTGWLGSASSPLHATSAPTLTQLLKSAGFVVLRADGNL